MANPVLPFSRFIVVPLLIILCFAGLASAWERLPGHIPYGTVNASQHLGRFGSGEKMSMAIVLPLRNEAELKTLLSRLYDPTDTLYGQYLSAQEFIERFSPTQDDYDAIAGYMRGLGFTVTGTHPNRTILNVSGPVSAVESAFNLSMHAYRTSNGRQFHAPDNDPEVPDFIAARIAGIVGLDNAAVWHAHSHYSPAAQASEISPSQIGTGPGGGLTPNDINTAYNLKDVNANGSGQILGLFELDGYNASDVANYVRYYNLPAVPLTNVLVDGYSGRAGSGASEVTLDIELQNALAPGASKIIVYEGPNTNTGVVDTYNRIATDNLAKQISTSWGLSEGQSSSSVINSENSAFMQMAAQGQSIYAASGDSGAYDNGSTLSVDDPASQPYMVGTGGTQLYLNADGSYSNETTWNNGSINSGAGGGGISKVWTIPSWQSSAINKNVCTLCSSAMRNVPDISLNSNQYTGYSVYYKNNWYIFGGTSCASPLWAAFTARVNQQRVEKKSALLGFANPLLYQLAATSTDFHDIADGSTNLYYPAVPGYDNATGLGSFVGDSLLVDLALITTPYPASPTGLTATAGSNAINLSWNLSTDGTSYKVYRGTSSGGEPFYKSVSTSAYTDSGVSAGTTYYYRVTAVNSKGYESDYSNEASAKLAIVALQISSGPSASPSQTSATISWTTNVQSNSVVSYGKTSTSLTKKVSNNSLVTSHSIGLTGLSRRTKYYYKVSSTAGSATVSSGVLSFTTN
jgi:kumamolisin